MESKARKTPRFVSNFTFTQNVFVFLSFGRSHYKHAWFCLFFSDCFRTNIRVDCFFITLACQLKCCCFFCWLISLIVRTFVWKKKKKSWSLITSCLIASFVFAKPWCLLPPFSFLYSPSLCLNPFPHSLYLLPLPLNSLCENISFFSFISLTLGFSILNTKVSYLSEF